MNPKYYFQEDEELDNDESYCNSIEKIKREKKNPYRQVKQRKPEKSWQTRRHEEEENT